MKASRTCDRRAFVQRLGALTAGTYWTVTSEVRASDAGSAGTRRSRTRARRALEVRLAAARAQDRMPLPQVRTNGDEQRYAGGAGCFTKGLPHNRLGDVAPSALEALLAAVESGRFEAFEAVPLGRNRKLVNPLGAYAFELEGRDPHRFALDPPPALASREQAVELAALYWMALARDVPFSAYEQDDVVGAAAADISRISGRAMSPRTVFRGSSPGALEGPFVSQFLLLDLPFGGIPVEPRIRTSPPGLDFSHTFERWLALQNGEAGGRLTFDPHPRFIRNLRDLALYVHRDFSFQAFLGAALILTATVGAPSFEDRGNPYFHSRTQSGFTTFGEPHLIDLVARVANAALKASWYQKWVVHRRPRPEEVAGRVHLQFARGLESPVDPIVFASPLFDRLAARHGTWFLTQAYPEGSPLHPSYPAGHAAIAGACATVLKAYVNEHAEVVDPVDVSPDGRSRVPYRGAPLTVGGEIDKLAMNVSVGRDAAGIHWASDGEAGRRLGEAVALSILADMKGCLAEETAGLTVTCFDGSTVAV